MPTLLFQGDSITDCGRERNTAELNSQRVYMGHGYAALAAARIWFDHARENWNIINRGISGNRVVDLYARWKIDAVNLNPDIISILIGVNDTWHEIMNKNGVGVARYDEFLRRLLAWSKEANPDVKLVLLEPFILPFGAVDESWQEEISARGEVVKKAAADFGAVFIPLQEKFNALAEMTSMDYCLRDGVHPTPAGHQLIADEWLKATAELF